MNDGIRWEMTTREKAEFICASMEGGLMPVAPDCRDCGRETHLPFDDNHAETCCYHEDNVEGF